MFLVINGCLANILNEATNILYYLNFSKRNNSKKPFSSNEFRIPVLGILEMISFNAFITILTF